jgi:hypothetical protein
MRDLVHRSIAAELSWRGLQVEVPHEKHEEDAQLDFGKLPACPHKDNRASAYIIHGQPEQVRATRMT